MSTSYRFRTIATVHTNAHIHEHTCMRWKNTAACNKLVPHAICRETVLPEICIDWRWIRWLWVCGTIMLLSAVFHSQHSVSGCKRHDCYCASHRCRPKRYECHADFHWMDILIMLSGLIFLITRIEWDREKHLVVLQWRLFTTILFDIERICVAKTFSGHLFGFASYRSVELESSMD